MESPTGDRPGAQAAAENNPGRRTTLATAMRGYDPAFERTLVDEITKAIALASITTDQNVIALRTGEMLGALATCMAATLALVSDADVPSRVRSMVDQLAGRIRRDAARARAEGAFDIFGAARGGRA
jgi:hypothetical protein